MGQDAKLFLVGGAMSKRKTIRFYAPANYLRCMAVFHDSNYTNGLLETLPPGRHKVNGPALFDNFYWPIEAVVENRL